MLISFISSTHPYWILMYLIYGGQIRIRPVANSLRARAVRRCFAVSKQIKRSFYRTQCYRVFDNHLYKSENMISSVYSYITSSSRHRVYIHFRRPIFSLGNKFECLSFVRTYTYIDIAERSAPNARF